MTKLSAPNLAQLFKFLGLVFLASNLANAGQTKIKSYKESRKNYFYTNLYQKGGFTLYCGKWFPVEI